jgi:hypothetical protein
MTIVTHFAARSLLRYFHFKRIPQPSLRKAYSTMEASNRLKAAFAKGNGPSFGLWQMIPGANVSRVLARSGVDWVMVDCEHGNIDGKFLPFCCFLRDVPLMPITR